MNECYIHCVSKNTSNFIFDDNLNKNKYIGDDTKGAARRIPNCIKKTKKYVLWNGVICPITE